MSMVLYEGGPGSHPLKLDEKRSEIWKLMNKVFSLVDLQHADLIPAFVFKAGHPAYPVFWDFAFDIHSQGQRWIFVGSGSD